MSYTLTAGIQPWMKQALHQGFKALNENRLKDAMGHCKKLLQAKPDLVEAHFLVGLIALEKGDRKVAIQAFGSVTTLNKKHSAGWAHLAKVFMDTGQINRADKALQGAVDYESGDHLVQHLIANLYTKLGDYQSAELWQSKAIKLNPKDMSYAVNHAYSLLYLGRITDCIEKLDHIFQYLPDHAQSHFMLSTAQKAKTFEHVEKLEELSERKNLQPRDSAFIHYALGKELEDLEEWDRAFLAFEKGATARRSILEYDEASNIAAFEALQETYTKEWLETNSEGFDDPSPIFVLGQPRTGTTLVERIITSHSDVHSAGELQQFTMSLRRLINFQSQNWFTSEFVEQAAQLNGKSVGEMYIKTSEKMQGDAPRFVDKMPPNFLHVPLILKALPNAKIVHVRRNPMDACFASYKQLFADAYVHSYDQKEMARYHARYYHLMACWRDRFEDRFFEISYEDVAQNLEPHARELIDYLGLSWEDSCLEFHKQDVQVATASTVQVREPAHTRSIGRWKKYENQLAPMQEELKKYNIDM